MIKFLIGGSPCTHWSIAQSKNRETTAEGIGWELFRNYLIAKEKFNPDFFLYENNKSASQAIKDQISKELRVPLQHINSALVSAQNRQRFYCHNFGDVPQPADRGILLQDVLESGVSWLEKSFAYTTRCVGAIPEDTLSKHRHTMVAEPVIFNTPHGFNKGGIKYEKAPTLTATGSYQHNNFIIQPIADRDKAECFRATYDKCGARNFEENIIRSKGYEGIPVYIDRLSADAVPQYIELENGRRLTIYKVENESITIKGNEYPIRLPDGYYILRKLTVTEACRLQTLPDDYCRAVSAAQAYKGIGNGWTAEVIIHLLSYALAGVPKDEEIIVLSMYDGIGTGRYCFDKLGYHNIKYYAYEIDKYAMQITQSNYDDVEQCGDAFQVRDDGWTIGSGVEK